MWRVHVATHMQAASTVLVRAQSNNLDTRTLPGSQLGSQARCEDLVKIMPIPGKESGPFSKEGTKAAGRQLTSDESPRFWGFPSTEIAVIHWCTLDRCLDFVVTWSITSPLSN